MPAPSTVLHASSVAVDGRGLLILGASGQGKSTLALEMIALGATLIADDRTVVTVQGNGLAASCPKAIAGRIEVRGIGILPLPHAPAPIDLAIDLDQTEPDRLPHPCTIEILGKHLRLLRNPATSSLASALLLSLRHGFAA